MNNLFLNKLAEVKISYSHKVKASDRQSIHCSRDAFQIANLIIPEDQVEHHEFFSILLLNRANQVLGYKHISEGGIAGTVTDVRIIFQAAIKANASAFIAIHNHPSGNLHPSEADKKITQKIKEAGLLLDISLLDHLIVTSESYYSFADDNIL
jgi:DNA repair protein RadC